MAGGTDQANDGAAKARARRQMLTDRAGALAAPRAAKAIARPAPADGGSVILGQVNSATSATTIINTADSPVLVCEADGTGGGIQIVAGTGPGLSSESDGGVGVSGVSSSSVGVAGVSDSGIGVWGVSNSDFAVIGVGFSSDAVVATSDRGDGVSATSSTGFGVSGFSVSNDGVHGVSDSDSSAGVHGVTGSLAGFGVLGESPYGGDGVVGTTGHGSGVHGQALSGDGVGVLAENSEGGIGLKVSGKAAFSRSGILTVPAGQSSVVSNGIPVTSESLVLATIQGNVPGVHVQGVTLGTVGGSFTIHLNKAVPTATNVAWFAIK
jgi:hypothetical protein